MKKPRWTNAELLLLGDLYRDGKSYNEIASKLNLSKSAVAYALNQYRYVINVPYRRDPDAYMSEPPIFARPTIEQQQKVEPKPWWKIW